MWKKTHVGGALGKLSSSWNDGVFLGVRGKSGEYIVGDRSGVWKARSLQRKPLGGTQCPQHGSVSSGHTCEVPFFAAASVEPFVPQGRGSL